jgi:hypothetical protein
MNIDSAFPSNYLKASDLGDAQPVVTIDRVELEAVGRDKEMKPVLYFRGKEKGIVLNKTNSNKIASLVGSRDTDHWRGNRSGSTRRRPSSAGRPSNASASRPPPKVVRRRSRRRHRRRIQSRSAI